MKIAKLMVEDMVSNAFKKMLIFFSERKGMTLKEISSKSLEEILTKPEYAFSLLMTRATVAFDMGLLSERDLADILSGKYPEKRKQWLLSLSDEFQQEYEKHWMNIVARCQKW